MRASSTTLDPCLTMLSSSLCPSKLLRGALDFFSASPPTSPRPLLFVEGAPEGDKFQPVHVVGAHPVLTVDVNVGEEVVIEGAINAERRPGLPACSSHSSTRSLQAM